MKFDKGEKLISDLFLNPSLFEKQKKGYRLMQEFYKGMPVETLIPLLESDNNDIQRTGMSIVSELKGKICGLMPYVVPFTESDDAFIRYCTSKFILSCAKGEYVKEFVHLIESINRKDVADHVLEMLLLSDADRGQLEEGCKLSVQSKINDYKLHQDGLTRLLNKDNSNEDIIEMLASKEPLTQRYGVIISGKKYRSNPELLNNAVLSVNPEIQEYAKFIIDLLED